MRFRGCLGFLLVALFAIALPARGDYSPECVKAKIALASAERTAKWKAAKFLSASRTLKITQGTLLKTITSIASTTVKYDKQYQKTDAARQSAQAKASEDCSQIAGSPNSAAAKACLRKVNSAKNRVAWYTKALARILAQKTASLGRLNTKRQRDETRVATAQSNYDKALKDRDDSATALNNAKTAEEAACANTNTPTPTVTPTKSPQLIKLSLVSTVDQPVYDGGQILYWYTCDGEVPTPPSSNAPSMEWTVDASIKDSVKGFFLSFLDLDAEGSGTNDKFVHWGLFMGGTNFVHLTDNIYESVIGFPIGKIPPFSDTKGDVLRQVMNDFGAYGYGGPCPPEKHNYVFTIYALNYIDFMVPDSEKDAEALVSKYSIAQAQFKVWYGPAKH